MQRQEFSDGPKLGILYITDYFASHGQEILGALHEIFPMIEHWSGTVGVGIASNNVEYFDEPAMCMMLCDFDVKNFHLFNGLKPLSSTIKEGFQADVALLHADPQTPELGDLVIEVAQSTQKNYLFGGLTSSRSQAIQFSFTADLLRVDPLFSGVFQGGLSGVAFSRDLPIISRVTQGCYPHSVTRRITKWDGHVVLELDHRAALDVLIEDLNISDDVLRVDFLQKIRSTLVGLTSGASHGVKKTGGLADDVCVRHIIGLDTARRGIAVAEVLQKDQQLTFCERHAAAAKADLTRICTEIRETLEPEEMSADQAVTLNQTTLEETPALSRKILGAIYVSCAGRGGPHFGAPSAELQIIKKSLGDIPLVGFFASGEIAYKNIFGYTGVLTVFIAQ